MPRLHGSNSFKAIVRMSMVTLLLSGCISWQVRYEPGLPDRIRITTESERFELREARLVGDTVVTGLATGNPRSVRLDEIQFLEEGQVDPGRTVLLIVGIPVGLVVACVFGIVCQGLH